MLLEGGTGIGKTRAYLHALASAEKRAAVVLPTHQLIDQLLASDDLGAAGLAPVAFRPRSFFDTRAEYEANKAAAQAAGVMLCTSASVIVDQRLRAGYNGVVERDYILFDEADQLPAVAALQSDLTVFPQEIKALGARGETPLALARSVLEAVARRPHSVDDPARVRAAASLAVETFEEPRWFRTAGLDEAGGLAVFHRLPGRLLKPVANRPNVAFVSATLSINGDFGDFRRAIGIGDVSELSGIVEPERHGSLEIDIRDVHPDHAGWFDQVVEAVGSAPRPCLVAAPSHDLAERIGHEVSGAIVRTREETISQSAARAADRVLVAAGAWAGLDTPVRWASIVVPRVPFDPPTVLDDHIESSYLDSRNTAYRRMRQVAGRGLRSPDARCRLIVLDNRIRQRGLIGFVPVRFRHAVPPTGRREGDRITVELSKAERDPAIRRDALRRHGRRCQSCGFVPKVDTQLDVHHLDPLKNGGRVTAIADVAVLCRNCHALAHSEDPPVPLERLRRLASGDNAC